jgi:multisubunit Na+/H+ antiporter MnhE subunit
MNRRGHDESIRSARGAAGLRLSTWLTWWGSCFLIWLGLTTTFDPAELLAGVLASAVAATGAELVRATGLIGFRPQAAWFFRAPRVAWRCIVDTGVVIGALLAHATGRRPMRGAFRTIPTDPGGDDPASAARRALLTAAISATPNTYVVGIDRERGEIVVHQLVPASMAEVKTEVAKGL